MNARTPTRIRSYKAPGQSIDSCTIVEASRATSAAPTFFKPAIINIQGVTMKYVDGGLAQNNPCSVVIEEAALVFPNRKITCIISIGTGKPSTNHIEKQGVVGRLIPIEVAKAMVRIATDTENTHQELQRRYTPRPNLYFRFNVEQGMQEVTMDEWNKLSAVMAHASQYVRSADVRPKLEEAAKILVERKSELSVSDAGEELYGLC